MRQSLCWAVLLGISVVGVQAQRLETQTTDTRKVTRVETTLDHLTVIELGDPVTMVAVGNQGAFTIERRENKVFVKPVEEGVKTNLFIWTTAGRFSYELVPAASVEQTHFAIDQAPAAIVAEASAPEEEPAADLAPLPVEMLTKASPIPLAGNRETVGRVEISLRELFRDGDHLYLRYGLINHSSQTYLPGRPAALRLSGIRSVQSLVPFDGYQLGERIVRSLKSADAAPLEVPDASEIGPVAAGTYALGWLVVNAPAKNATGGSLLRLEFAADTKGPVEATLVLPGSKYRRGVADARSAGK